MVRMGATNIKSEDDISGGKRPLPGRYHCVVKHVDESFEKVDKVVVTFEVLAGTTPDQQGREIVEYYACTEKALPRLTRLAIVTGVLQPGEAERDVEFTPAIGAHLVVEVEENKYTKQDGTEVETVRIGYMGMWSLGNDEVKEVPKDQQAIDLWRNSGFGGGAAEVATQQQAAPQQAPEAPAPAASTWDNL